MGEIHMEISGTDFQILRQEIKELEDYVARVHQYHLGAKPSFLHRNHWNEINDALHLTTLKLIAIRAQAARIERERTDVAKNAVPIPRPDSDIREA